MRSMDDTKRTISVPDTSGIFIVFDLKAGAANGKGVCNTFHTAFTCKDTTITFTNFATTKMMCKGQTFEGVVLNFIKIATMWKLHGNQLILSQANGSNIVFEGRESDK